MAPDRLSIASVWTFLSAALLCLLLGGCSSGGSFQTHRPPAEAVFFSNEEGAPGDGSAGTGQGSGEKGKAGQNKIARKKAYENRAGGENEAGTRGEALSLLRGGDAEDYNLALLLTEDYLRQFDIPIVLNDAVQYFVRYFTAEKRKVFTHWLQRSRRYVPMIKEILRGHGLPEDLIYVAMIESGFNPKAYSSMKACGPWQFIYETGGRYGLRVNHWVDERRDPEKSTVAAALYLKDLFNQFGSWYLAAAAYNAGEKRIERSVEMHETGDFWELTKYNTLPRETKEYIPKLLAAALIAKDPEKFGFTGISYDQPVSFVSESAPGGTPLATLAQVASTDVETIKALNPEILTNIIPPDVGEYTIRLPESTRRDGFRDALKAALERKKRVQEATAYTFKRRDSLARVMKRYKVGYSDLLLVNSYDRDLRVKAGAVLYIPRFYSPRQRVEMARETGPGEGKAQAEARPRATRPPVRVVSASAARTGYHIVRKGENLAGISARYGMNLAVLKEINGLKKDRVRPDMRLRLTGRAGAGERNVRTASYRVVKKGRTKNRVKTAKETSRHKKRKARTARSRAQAAEG